MKVGNLNLRELSLNQMLKVSGGGGKKGGKNSGSSKGSNSGGCKNSSSGNSSGGCGCGGPIIPI